MNLAAFKFVIIEAPECTPVRGPAVYDKEGKRIGQLIIELSDSPWKTEGRSFPDELVAEMRVNTPEGAVSVVNPEGRRTTVANEGTEETGADRPAAPISNEVSR